MRRKKNLRTLIIQMPIIFLLVTSIIGISYGYWTDQLKIDSVIRTGQWYTPQELQVGLIKEIDGVYLDEEMKDVIEVCEGDHLLYHTQPSENKVNQIYRELVTQGPGEPDPDTMPVIFVSYGDPKDTSDPNTWDCIVGKLTTFPQWFKLTLTVTNGEVIDLQYLTVEDYIDKKILPVWVELDSDPGVMDLTPIDWGNNQYMDNGNGKVNIEKVLNPSNGKLVEYKVTWDITDLGPTSGIISDTITVWLVTTDQGAGKYHPTDECGDELPINKYAQLEFDDPTGYHHVASTGSIHFVTKDDYYDIDHWAELYLDTDPPVLAVFPEIRDVYIDL